MNEKYLKLTQQFEKTVAAICQSPYEYNRFLTTAAHNYRLSFKNAVLAYAQGTDKDLLLTYEQWQRYGRVPKRHSKATLLIDTAAKERYLVTFAASKTVVDKRIHQHKELRYFSYTVTPETIAAIQSIFHSESNDLREMLYARVREQFENFFDDAYPAFENETDFLTKSVTNMLFSRFGEKMPYDNILSPFGINPDNIEHIYQMVIDVFRAEYAELATLIPEEIEKQHIFTEDDDLPFDDVSTSEDTKPMLDHGSETRLYAVITNAGDDGGYDEKPECATLDEAVKAGQAYMADGYFGFSVYNRETKRIEYTAGDFNVTQAYSPDVLQSNNISVPDIAPSEQDQKIEAPLTHFDEKAQERKYPFFGVSEVVNELFATTPHLHASLSEIGAFYESDGNQQSREEYIRSIFNNGFTEVDLSNETHVGYKTYENGVLIWKGDYPNRTGQSFLRWNAVAGHFEAMRLLGMLQGDSAADNRDGQLQLFPDVAEAKKGAFSFSQELIDRVLQRGTGFKNGKFGIYEQFQKRQSANDNIAFLKNSYGWGGCSEVVPYTGVAEDHNSKGILLRIGYNENSPRQLLKWSEVERHIRELMQADRYLSVSEKNGYPDWLAEQERKREQIKAERELTEAVYQPSEPIDISASSDRTDVEQPKVQYTPTMQEYFKVKGENPDRIILFQIGDFYEAMGDDAKVVSDELELILTHRRLSGDEGIEMCGFPFFRLEANLHTLLNKGFKIGVSSVDESNRRTLVLMDSNQQKASVQSENDELLNRAQELIGEYMDMEFGEGEIYELPEDLSSINLAYTNTEDEQHEITAYLNLVDYRIETKVDDQLVRAEQFDSLQDIIENGLDGMRFDDLTYVSDEELAPFYDKESTEAEQPTEEEIAPVPSEKPVVQLTQEDIDSLIVLKPNVLNGKSEIYHAVISEQAESNLLGMVKQIYYGGNRYTRSSNGLFLNISGNSNGILVLETSNAYSPLTITYPQLIKRIKELIDTNRYLSDDEFRSYIADHQLTDKATALRQVNFKYEIGDTVTISGQAYVISSASPFEITVYQADAPLFNHSYDRKGFEALLLQNIDDNLGLVRRAETKYELYQIVDTEQAHQYIFQSLESLDKLGIKVERSHYELVYSGVLGEGERLNSLYEKFNIHHPVDFEGRSMSVSDVVVLTKFGERKAYYCDRIGFSEIPDFLYQEQKQEYILFHPKERSVSWIYFNPDGNHGDGQIVHESISVDELAGSIGALTREDLSEFFAVNGMQRVQDIEVPEQSEREYEQYVSEQPNGMRLIWTPVTSEEDFSTFKDTVSEFQQASSVMKQPQVAINFSEHPALSELVKDKTRLRFSFANELLGRLDMLENAKRENPDSGLYYKTDFTIYGSEEGIRLLLFNGRYDLADGENDLIGHIEHIRDFDDSQNVPSYNKWLVMLRDSLERNPLTEIEKSEIEQLVTQDYGLDETEDVQLPKAPDHSDLIDKIVEYADKFFRVTSVNPFGQAHLEDISSLSEGLIPIDTVLPVETVRELIEAQSDKNPENYVITDDHIGVGTPSQRFENNLAAIKTVQQLQAQERSATKAEQEIMAKYVGWGGLSRYFEESNARRDELKRLLSESDYQSAYESTLTSFYTPPVVIKAVYGALTNMGFTNGRILDPACGTGHFFGALPVHLAQSQLFGVEIDNISGQIAKALYPNANIKIQGYQDTNIPNNSIDVAVGNVPFGDYRVFDKGYNKHRLMIHDYFFIKTIDKVRPGGIVAFITSKGTLDKRDTKARELLAEKADLLGAIRLPNNTFKAAAGTEVTSDIIFLQKRESSEILKEYPDWVYTSEDAQGILMNNYFVAHPEMICGEMVITSGRFGAESACVLPDGINLGNTLDAAIRNIQGEYIPYTAVDEESVETETIAADDAARNYSYFVNNDTLYYRENGIMFVSHYEGRKADRIKGMVRLTDITRDLIDAEVSGESDNNVETLRRQLNDEYDSFSSEYGSLNSFANRVFKEDNSYPLLCSLEKVIVNEETEEKSYVKTDIFSKRTIAPHTEISSAENAEEALIISVSQKGRVDLEYMASLTGDTQEQLINELNGSSIFLKPYEGEYVTADEYLSGNVRQKLETARMAANDDKKYNVNVKALEAVIPKDIPASEIVVRLGTTWIPVKYYNDFLQETFHPQSRSIEVQYNAMMGNYYITCKSFDNHSIESVVKYGIKERNGYTVMEDCLNLKSSEVHKTVIIDGRERSVLDKDKTVIVQNRQEMLKARFADWIYKDPSRRRDLEQIYNDKFNCIVPREFDGSHLTFPGKNPNITLRPHQLNAIARGLYGGNTLLAHCVGAGKSFEMIAIAMKLKELGLAHKSLICVPKHLVSQMGAEFLRLYPAANVLVAEEKDFTPQNRKRFCTRIATGDYDAIIIGHTQLEKIPLKPDTQIEILNKQLDDIMDALLEAKEEGLAGATVKSLTKSKKRIESKLAELQQRSQKKDNVISFEELGVDQIFVDEAHLFKNRAKRCA